MSSANSSAAALVGVVKRYGANVALDGVSLSIARGKVTALLGPNGAGKSTAIALLLGLTTADTGSAELFGRSPQLLAARRRIGVMLQTAALPDTLRVGELVQLTSSYYARPRALADVARITGIASLLRRPYGSLSGGQQRRVQFALAICGNPELLFLDEPTTGLDIEARESLWAVVRSLVAEGSAVLLSTHYLEEAEALAHRVAVLMRGRIVNEGTVDEIRALGVRRRIRCVTRVAAAEVRGWPGVEAVIDATAGAAVAMAVGAGAVGTVGDVGIAGQVGTGGEACARTAGDTVAGEAVVVTVVTAGEASARAATDTVAGEAVGSEYRLDVSAVLAEPIVRRLLAADPQLRELEVSRAGLAEAFVQITREAA